MGRVIIAILLIVSCIIVLAGCQAAPPQPTPPPTSPTPAPEISPEPAATSTEEESSISVLAITSVSPDLGSLEGDTIIQISGENITSGAIVFFIQGDVAQEGVRTTVLSDTVIVTRTPSVSRAGVADIQVALPDGQTATLGDAFRYTTGFEAPPVTTPPPQVVPVSSEKLKVHFIDVGQGDAILIDLEDSLVFRVTSAVSLSIISLLYSVSVSVCLGCSFFSSGIGNDTISESPSLGWSNNILGRYFTTSAWSILFRPYFRYYGGHSYNVINPDFCVNVSVF